MNEVPESVWYAAKTLHDRSCEILDGRLRQVISTEKDSWLCAFLVSEWIITEHAKPAGIEDDSGLIQWHETTDGNGPETWEGASPYSSDTDSSPDVMWRIKFREWHNEVEWYAEHDGELGGDTGQTWPTLSAAQAEIQREHNAIMDDIKKSKETTGQRDNSNGET